MASSNRNTQQLVTLLQRTVEARVLAGLQEVVHEAVVQATDEVVAVAVPQAASKPRDGAQAAQPQLKRPVAGGRCAAVWDKLDEMLAAGEMPTLAQVRKLAKRQKWNENNARIEYYRWRNYVGSAGHMAAPTKPAVTPAVPAKAAPGVPMVVTPAYNGPDRRKAH